VNPAKRPVKETFGDVVEVDAINVSLSSDPYDRFAWHIRCSGLFVPCFVRLLAYRNNDEIVFWADHRTQITQLFRWSRLPIEGVLGPL
jgi:hypothetical protein